jgi:hypothetical protein
MEKLIAYIERRIVILGRAKDRTNAIPNPWAARLTEMCMVLDEAKKEQRRLVRKRR